MTFISYMLLTPRELKYTIEKFLCLANVLLKNSLCFQIRFLNEIDLWDYPCIIIPNNNNNNN